jgi:hypothetical protein
VIVPEKYVMPLLTNFETVELFLTGGGGGNSFILVTGSCDCICPSLTVIYSPLNSSQTASPDLCWVAHSFGKPVRFDI